MAGRQNGDGWQALGVLTQSLAHTLTHFAVLKLGQHKMKRSVVYQKRGARARVCVWCVCVLEYRCIP